MYAKKKVCCNICAFVGVTYLKNKKYFRQHCHLAETSIFTTRTNFCTMCRLRDGFQLHANYELHHIDINQN